MCAISYRVRLPEFEGPLDVLLFLVQREELPVRDISLARLVEQFLTYLRWVEVLDLEVAAEFFVVAAELLAIKARWLLHPSSKAVSDRGLTVGEAPELLWERLMEYRSYKYAAAFLRQRMAQGGYCYVRLSSMAWQRQSMPTAWENANLTALTQALRGLLHRVGSNVVMSLPHTERSTAEYMDTILYTVRRRPWIQFSALVSGCSREETVLYFLTMLELVRQGLLTVEQEGPFQELLLRADVADAYEPEYAPSVT
ncbi:MAG: segregation/condensation protein A [Candidatus Kapabacteria bacterium]|nr:segregation/condensation protein A [Candidatus Kapabacteria bacterium]